ncbi:MAG: hypothetical protein WC622_05755 [Pedobacter sp.]|jgi:hypothetical protein|uniref:hypothetical protein n=1 Tax=Pedobacter sp. TaxID=1411316 RepID=UPI0035683260
MRKSLIISLLFIILTSTYSVAQKTYADSIKKAVRIDAQKFRLNATDFKKFRDGSISKNSDLFKPYSTVSVPQFLKDSTYVSAYRNATYLKTLKRRTAGHHVLIWGTAIVMAPTIVFLAL